MDCFKRFKKAFIKFDVSIPYLKRLSELGIAPHVLASGQFEGRTFIIQEFIEGTHPDTSWFLNSIPNIGSVIKKYHSDELLTKELRNDGRILTYDDQLKDLSTRINLISDQKLKNLYSTILEKLKGKNGLLQTKILVPVHADPNLSNFLVEREKTMIIDWDDILLSDPLRDVGLICFWYLPQEKWVEFMNVMEIDLHSDWYERIYWWVTAQSLAISIWFWERGEIKNMQLYLEDAQSAIKMGPNPHLIF